eukprot:s1864_g3.t5
MWRVARAVRHFILFLAYLKVIFSSFEFPIFRSDLIRSHFKGAKRGSTQNLAFELFQFELMGKTVTFLEDCVGEKVESACADPAPGSADAQYESRFQDPVSQSTSFGCFSTPCGDFLLAHMLNLPLAVAERKRNGGEVRDHDSTAFPSEAGSRVWTRQASPDTDVTPVGRTVDFQQLKAAVLRAKLERCHGECEGSPQQRDEDEDESAVAVHRIAMAARRYASGSPMPA